MSTRRRVALAAVLAVLVASVAGCGSNPERETSVGGGGMRGEIYTTYVPLPDGGEVLCAVYAAPYRGGLSCDWEVAR